ncbi:hypothetical protein O181_053682 [Austropuccinia psidii MF-1]|uniref:Uncharacterized protein n=1 Tax=Austropuccinia psidii MF-1 TaxID=1389203 RepID=A0A9Q3E5C9_9BASI|nr:hypothetical protein [Austropuccinia psidii MF-1]
MDKISPQSWLPPSGCLNATEWDPLYKVYIPSLILSKQISLDEHNYPNMQIKMVKSEDLENELTKNTFHLINAINITKSCTVSMDDATVFSEHWKNFFLSNKNLFPKQKSKPNNCFADNIVDHFQFWGPAQDSDTWDY